MKAHTYANVLRMAFGLASVALTATVVSSPNCFAKESESDERKRPNIVLVLVDDMGYSDLGCYGSEIQTPVLDRLATNGVRFERFYNCSQCTPSRAALLTGLYPHQAGLGDMNAKGPTDTFWKTVGSPAYLGFKKPNSGVCTIAEILRTGGYQTFMSGKWHLGDTPDNWPSARGFERTFCLIPGAHEHFTGRHAWKESGPIAPHILDGKLLESLPDDFYSTDTFTDYAIRFIKDGKSDSPWFLYLSYTAPHWPLQAHEKDAAKYKEIYTHHPESLRHARLERMKKMKLISESAILPPLENGVTSEGIESNREWRDRSNLDYAGMIECVDRNIGRLVEFLESRGELENTLFLFASDNGADTVRGPLWGALNNAPFRSVKTSAYEGGITTPLVVHWPKGIGSQQAGKIIYGYAHFIDIMPTILSACGLKYPSHFNEHALLPCEGIDLLSAIQGLSSLPSNRPLFWERMGNEAVRLGDLKLVRRYSDLSEKDGAPKVDGPRTGTWELYNVTNDPGETNNLIGKFESDTGKLRDLWQAWADRVGVIPREKILDYFKN